MKTLKRIAFFLFFTSFILAIAFNSSKDEDIVDKISTSMFIASILLFITYTILLSYLSHYISAERELNKILITAKKEQDWQKIQEINLQILWLNIIRDLVIRGLTNFKKPEDQEINTALGKLSKDEITFPSELNLTDEKHHLFALRVSSDFGKLLAENDYKGAYKPESILPYPKTAIMEIMQLLVKSIKNKHFDLNINNKPDNVSDGEYLKRLEGCMAYLEFFFIDINENELPKTVLENVNIGLDYVKVQKPDS
jgi:hypothetical protein